MVIFRRLRRKRNMLLLWVWTRLRTDVRLEKLVLLSWVVIVVLGCAS